MTVLIEAENLCKTYGKDAGEVKALDNVSFEVEEGEMTAISGPSGSGKSTLLHLLGGLDKPSSGLVKYEGNNIHAMSEHRLSEFRLNSIGFVFQFFGLIPELTAWNNIILPAKLGRSFDKTHINRLCEALGITDRLTHYPNELSGGQRQRVAIARALVNKPKVLLCDEPTGNLDAASSREVISLLKHIRDELGQTILIITHDITVAEQCTRRLTIRDGKLT